MLVFKHSNAKETSAFCFFGKTYKSTRPVLIAPHSLNIIFVPF